MNAETIERIEKRGIEVSVTISDEEQNVRHYDYRSPRERKRKAVKNLRLVKMREKLQTVEGREIYAKRAKKVEPVFGIIKAPMGFHQFLLWGLDKVRIEWDRRGEREINSGAGTPSQEMAYAGVAWICTPRHLYH